ncbi:Cinnamyl alcohol dehydrogenase [Thalictrum thalictroides]|uniref:Cinnamyl alcohol dehydrogenase n=1 Tax=Thalictrum thalictroides TaxID=46969 RepID=A0A7J6WCB5_THATH|nr:Cinnamyl alcohol dehydrogenase [Thalictrum thalictroides]
MSSEGESADSNSSMPGSGNGVNCNVSWRQFVLVGYFSKANLQFWAYLTPGQMYRRALHDFLLVFPQNPDVSWHWEAGIDLGTAEEIMWYVFVETVLLVERFELTAENVTGGHMRKLIERIKDLKEWKFNINFLKADLDFMVAGFLLELKNAVASYKALQRAQARVGSGVASCLDAAVRRSMERDIYTLTGSVTTSGLLSYRMQCSKMRNARKMLARDNDITLNVLYCGICHSDLHSIKNEWNNALYPMEPGHEIVGIVTEVWSNVTKFKVGDKAGVGCMVGSCRSCDSCAQDVENYCSKIMFTYNFDYYDGTRTYGGYSNKFVVDEHFGVNVPDNMPLDAAVPLLCAGITVYSPMKYFGLSKPGMHLGVIGLGGLGHVAVKFAKAFGMKVTVISTSITKKEESIDRLGADVFLVSRDLDQMQAAMGTLDGIINSLCPAFTPAIDMSAKE